MLHHPFFSLKASPSIFRICLRRSNCAWTALWTPLRRRCLTVSFVISFQDVFVYLSAIDWYSEEGKLGSCCSESVGSFWPSCILVGKPLLIADSTAADAGAAGAGRGGSSHAFSMEVRHEILSIPYASRSWLVVREK